MSRIRRLHVVTSVLAVVVTAAADGAFAKSPAPGTYFSYPERVQLSNGEWREAERGMLFVPAIRGKADSGILGIEFYRFAAAAGAPGDMPPVFQLHGGPGWPGIGDSLEEPSYWEDRITPFASMTELIVVGQRGIGSSKPDTVCEAPPQPEEDTEESDEESARRVRETAERCRAFWEERGLALTGLNVKEAAGDVADLAKALGYSKIIVSGGSFGSHWGMAVLRYHPQIVARAVLTGLEGPDHTYDMPSYVLNALEKIAAAAEASPELAPHLPQEGILDAYRKLIAEADAEPIVVTVENEDGESEEVSFDGDDLRGMFRGPTGTAGSRDRLPGWPKEMLALLSGDLSVPAERRVNDDGQGGYPTASFFMLDCGSGISTKRAEQLAADPAVDTVGKIGQFYQWSCPAWGSDLGEKFRKNFKTSVPTVLVHGTWDLSTPFENALELEPFFTKGRLVVVEGGTHGALGEVFRGDEAFRDALLKFVRTGDVSDVPERVELPPIEWEIPEAGEAGT